MAQVLSDKEEDAMSRKTNSALVFVIGIVVLVLFAMADLIGIGENPDFGPVQIAGTIVGAVLAVVGLIMLYKK